MCIEDRLSKRRSLRLTNVRALMPEATHVVPQAPTHRYSEPSRSAATTTINALPKTTHHSQSPSLPISSFPHRYPGVAQKCMLPCSLNRQYCLIGQELATHLRLPHLLLPDYPPLSPSSDIMDYATHSPAPLSDNADSWTLLSTGPASVFGANTSDASSQDDVDSLNLVRVHANSDADERDELTTGSHLSRLEYTLTNYEPILETLLSHLPTASIFNLQRSSQYLRQFLRSYPLAWKTLSFRLPQPSAVLGSPSGDADSRDRNSRQYSLDLALKMVILPVASRLTNLDLCNTSVSGVTLVGNVLNKRAETLQHLSVRGCKNVSLKYHIVPFLRCYKQELEITGGKTSTLALNSLYTYRCRHHRRRPYLPSSLFRRDSDSEPTHELIELCHLLKIWTDTSWCPTPGPRCLRRKDYHGNRAGQGTTEVWVPFDRLWRSGNRIGPGVDTPRGEKSVGKLWEEIECGHDGEPLGLKNGAFAGEGKDVPTHQRRSHRQFVENIKCDDCGDILLERCETCSIKMHCMGCRKTLCSSCAFNKPYRLKKAQLTSGIHITNSSYTWDRAKPKTKKKVSKFWWAPGARRSPNVMVDAPEDSDSDTEGHLPVPPPQAQNEPLKLNMHWCCLEPLFSGGGGVAFVGPGLAGHGSERIRAVPLPKLREYLDPDFAHTSLIPPVTLSDLNKKKAEKFEEIVGANIDILPYLQQTSLNLQASTCPRSLCQSCYHSFRWKVSCKACNRPICKEHDFRALKVRKCGYRDLMEEREYVRNPPKHVGDGLILDSAKHEWPIDLRIPAFSHPESPVEHEDGATADAEKERRARSSGIDDGPEESDAGSAVDGPGTRDPSSTPRATPGPSVDRSRSVRADVDLANRSAEIDLGDTTPTRSRSPSGLSIGQLRLRSVSLSDLAAAAASGQRIDGSSIIGKGKNRVSTQPIAKERLLLPCAPAHPVQWKGCGAYFCQSVRAMGDGRQRCGAYGKDCVECGVYVCDVSSNS
jgi:hypothetical protein